MMHIWHGLGMYQNTKELNWKEENRWCNRMFLYRSGSGVPCSNTICAITYSKKEVEYKNTQ